MLFVPRPDTARGILGPNLVEEDYVRDAVARSHACIDHRADVVRAANGNHSHTVASQLLSRSAIARSPSATSRD